jgi:P-type E1-E2 ATPase
VATGARTRLAGIAKLTQSQRSAPTPLRRELDRVSRIIAAVAIAVGVAFFSIALLLGIPASNGFLFAVGVTVAVVPCGLLPTVTLSLAMGAQRMAEGRALVRHLEAVETLGSTTFICTDKTGTLTQNSRKLESCSAAVWCVRSRQWLLRLASRKGFSTRSDASVVQERSDRPRPASHVTTEQRQRRGGRSPQHLVSSD